MSRVGEQPIVLSKGVEVSIVDDGVSVKGPKGSLTRRLHADMQVSSENGVVKVSRPSDGREHRSLHGLTRSLLANMVIGVSEGFEKTLDLVGVGYRVQQSGKNLTLSVMLSHTVEVKPLEDIELKVEGNNVIRVRGMDKQAVGQIAAQIRSIRPPNAYTGKGIRYRGEQIKLKPGKSARRGLE
jgi:large subunit ribosomal protein L6